MSSSLMTERLPTIAAAFCIVSTSLICFGVRVDYHGIKNRAYLAFPAFLAGREVHKKTGKSYKMPGGYLGVNGRQKQTFMD